MKGTLDMVKKDGPDSKLFMFESSCAPSQKLKEDSKDAFHNLRLGIATRMKSLQNVPVIQ